MSDADHLLHLATTLGHPSPSRPAGQVLDRLVPLARAQAHPRSMSAVFGEGAFPFHTDLAHYPCPPRFVLLRAAQTDRMVRPTLLHDSRRLPLTPTERQLLSHGPFLTRGGRRPFLSTIVDRVPRLSDAVVRYDGCCMTPASSSARTAELLLARKMDEREPVRINWYYGQTIVLDNWRVLHARAPAHPGSLPENRASVLRSGLASDNGGYVNPPSPPVGAVFMGSWRGLGVEPARPLYRMRAN